MDHGSAPLKRLVRDDEKSGRRLTYNGSFAPAFATVTRLVL